MRRRLFPVALLVMAVVVSACGESTEVGSGVKEVESRPEACRLGQVCPTPSPKATQQAGGLGLGQSPSPSPQPARTTAPREDQVAVTVTIPEGGNYDPFFIELEAGAVLKVVNKDCRAEVPNGRSFSARDGTFDSGLLKCNQEWLWRANAIGEFDVFDRSGFPSQAKLIVKG